MLTAEELESVKQFVLRELPRVLEQDPGFVVFVEGIVSEKFPRRDEFARALDEFTGFRAETRQSFADVGQQFSEVHEELQRINTKLEKADERFDKVDERLEKVDERFDKVDERLEKVDERFEKVDERFEKVDERFDRVEGQLGGLTQEVRDLRDWVQMIAGGLQNRVGRNLEDIVAGALRLGLGRPDVSAANIRMRQKLHDPSGLVFKAGKQKEVDLVVQNGELLVFEVKSAPDEDDVDAFADKVALVRLQNPDKVVTGVFVAVGADDVVRSECSRLGLRLIPEKK